VFLDSVRADRQDKVNTCIFCNFSSPTRQKFLFAALSFIKTYRWPRRLSVDQLLITRILFIDSPRTAALSLRRLTSAGTSSDSCHASGNNKGDLVFGVHLHNLVATDFKSNTNGVVEHLQWNWWICETIGGNAWRLNLNCFYMNSAQQKCIQCKYTWSDIIAFNLNILSHFCPRTCRP
jgi:hypothetical protein